MMNLNNIPEGRYRCVIVYDSYTKGMFVGPVSSDSSSAHLFLPCGYIMVYYMIYLIWYIITAVYRVQIDQMNLTIGNGPLPLCDSSRLFIVQILYRLFSVLRQQFESFNDKHYLKRQLIVPLQRCTIQFQITLSQY